MTLTGSGLSAVGPDSEHGGGPVAHHGVGVVPRAHAALLEHGPARRALVELAAVCRVSLARVDRVLTGLWIYKYVRLLNVYTATLLLNLALTELYDTFRNMTKVV